MKDDANGARRRRLPPAQRVREILDAALVEFCERGYADTRMEDIALRAGLSKGGLYAHFGSKDAVFDALLRRSLDPPALDELPRPAAEMPARELAQWLVDRLCQRVAEPGALRTLWLMIAERDRVAPLLAIWDRQVLGPYEELLRQVLAARGAGGARPGVLARAPWLALSPLVHAAVRQLMLGPREADETARWRAAYVDLLVELMEPGAGR